MPAARVYALDETTGEIRFGDGLHGMIPPIGRDSIVAFSYQRTEPGRTGKRSRAGQRRSSPRTAFNLVSPVESVESVIAADQAAGGAPPESDDRVLRFGFARLRHRERAVSARDLEDLALRSSPDIVQARCLIRARSRPAGRRHARATTRCRTPRRSASSGGCCSMPRPTSLSGAERAADRGTVRAAGCASTSSCASPRSTMRARSLVPSRSVWQRSSTRPTGGVDKRRMAARRRTRREEDVALALIDTPQLESIADVSAARDHAMARRTAVARGDQADRARHARRRSRAHPVRDRGGGRMSALAPKLFDRRFQDLVEIGRARLRSLAPEWTDHNAHDPGITLMELLAWVAEAQLYSLSRLRRDERASYAALLGLATTGTRGARGLIWPDHLDPGSPAATFARSLVISDDAVVHMVGSETPTFRPTHTLLWTPGRTVKLETRHADGRTTDHTTMNARGGPAFLPLGETAGRRVVLALTFECRDDAGLFGATRQQATKALWSIGVRAATPSGGAAEETRQDRDEQARRPSPLTATLVVGTERLPVKIVSDSTEGLFTTGVILFDLADVAISPRQFTIELRAERGLARAPRVLRIEPNVVPVRQGRAISRESHDAAGTPDWSFTLDAPGVRFGPGEDPITLQVPEVDGLNNWHRDDDLSDRGPNDNVFALNTRTGEVTFGNGVNGRMPPAGSHVLVSYAVSDAEQGNVARNRRWKVDGFGGAFGVNLRSDDRRRGAVGLDRRPPRSPTQIA